jgi:hypothetical protein
MKTIEVTDEEYKTLEVLGSDAWMGETGEIPKTPEQVVSRLIEKERQEALAHPQKTGHSLPPCTGQMIRFKYKARVTALDPQKLCTQEEERHEV